MDLPILKIKSRNIQYYTVTCGILTSYHKVAFGTAEGLCIKKTRSLGPFQGRLEIAMKTILDKLFRQLRNVLAAEHDKWVGDNSSQRHGNI
jgi:hypothetical protein